MRLLPAAVYLLCAGTSIVCSILLLRSYISTRSRILLFSFLCFTGLAVNNLLLFADIVLLPNIDLRWLRELSALAAVTVLLYGFIWEID